MWDRYDVAGPSTLVKLIGHADVGLLRLEPANLWLSQRGKVRATVHTPADDDTEQRLHLALARSSSRREEAGR